MKNGNHRDGTGIDRKLHNPIEDRLIPLESLDLSSVRTVNDLVEAMGKTAFTGRQVGEAADVLEAMARDTECFVVMTLSGAMTVAKQSLIIADLIDRGIVNAIVSTGALMAHGLVEATGRAHFRYNPDVSDTELYEQGYNRVYDTLEPEQNLDDVEEVMSHVLESWDHSEVLCSYKLNHAIGEYLAKHAKGQRGILKSAYENGVPGFCAGVYRFGVGFGRSAEQSPARVDRKTQTAIRSVRRSRTFRGHAIAPNQAWDFHYRRRRSPQLGAAVRTFL